MPHMAMSPESPSSVRPPAPPGPPHPAPADQSPKVIFFIFFLKYKNPHLILGDPVPVEQHELELHLGEPLLAARQVEHERLVKHRVDLSLNVCSNQAQFLLF